MPNPRDAVKNIKRTELTIIIPTLNAAETLPATLAALAGAETLVVDGGSVDGTPLLAAGRGARVITALRGRGPQLVAGAAAATTPWLLFLHADTVLAPGWQTAVQHHMATAPGKAAYFRFALDSPDPRARRLERRVAWRCRVLTLPYGDQGLLISRTLLASVGGVRPIPLMEDVDLVRRLGCRLAALPIAVTTSAQRWDREGWRRRSARNLACLALWSLGVSPRILVRLYG